MFGRSVFYIVAIVLILAAFEFWGWVGFAVLMAFAAGFHLRFRLQRGHWMQPED